MQQPETFSPLVTRLSHRPVVEARAVPGYDPIFNAGLLVHEGTYHLFARGVRDGYHPIIIGQRGHVEVRGLTEDLEAFDVVLDESEVEGLTPRPRLGVAAQTTQPIEKVRRLVACIRRRFHDADVRFIDTVCRPTKQRQTAAIDMARAADVVIVVGGASSNNTRQLAETCALYCARVHLVQTDADLCADWFRATDTVGLTAGTSTPDEVVDRVEARIRAFPANTTELVPTRRASR